MDMDTNEYQTLTCSIESGDLSSHGEEIVVSSYEDLVSENVSCENDDDQIEREVLGYLEVQPSDADNATIILNPEGIDLDGQHLILTQSEEGNEIIVMVSSDQDGISEETVSHFAHGSVMGSDMIPIEGEVDHTVVVGGDDPSSTHLELIETEVSEIPQSNDDGHHQVFVERNGSLSLELGCQDIVENSMDIEWTVKDCDVQEKNDSSDMLFIPTESDLTPSLLPSSEENKTPDLMQLACVAQEMHEATDKTSQVSSEQSKSDELFENSNFQQLAFEEQSQSLLESTEIIQSSTTAESAVDSEAPHNSEHMDTEISYASYECSSEAQGDTVSVVEISSTPKYPHMNPIEEVVEVVAENNIQESSEGESQPAFTLLDKQSMDKKSTSVHKSDQDVLQKKKKQLSEARPFRYRHEQNEEKKWNLGFASRKDRIGDYKIRGVTDVTKSSQSSENSSNCLGTESDDQPQIKKSRVKTIEEMLQDVLKRPVSDGEMAKKETLKSTGRVSPIQIPYCPETYTGIGANLSDENFYLAGVVDLPEGEMPKPRDLIDSKDEIRSLLTENDYLSSSFNKLTDGEIPMLIQKRRRNKRLGMTPSRVYPKRNGSIDSEKAATQTTATNSQLSEVDDTITEEVDNEHASEVSAQSQEKVTKSNNTSMQLGTKLAVVLVDNLSDEAVAELTSQTIPKRKDARTRKGINSNVLTSLSNESHNKGQLTNDVEKNHIQKNAKEGSGHDKIPKAITVEETTVKPPRKTYTRRSKVPDYSIPDPKLSSDVKIELFSFEELGADVFSYNDLSAEPRMPDASTTSKESANVHEDVTSDTKKEGSGTSSLKTKSIKSKAKTVQPRSMRTRTLNANKNSPVPSVDENAEPSKAKSKKKDAEEKIDEATASTPDIIHISENESSEKTPQKDDDDDTEQENESLNSSQPDDGSLNKADHLLPLKKRRSKVPKIKEKSRNSWDKLVKSSPAKLKNFKRINRKKLKEKVQKQFMSLCDPAYTVKRKRGRPRKIPLPLDPKKPVASKKDETHHKKKRKFVHERLQNTGMTTNLASPYYCSSCCKFSSERLQNVILHAKRCFSDPDPIDYALDDMDRRQRIRGEDEGASQSNENCPNGLSSASASENIEPEGSKQSGIYSDFESDEDVVPMYDARLKRLFGFCNDDVVWVRMRKLFWPALVCHIYPNERLASIMLVDPPPRKKGFKVSVRKLRSFDDAELNKRILNNGRNCVYPEKFIRAVQKAENFARKRNVLKCKVDSGGFFNINIDDSSQFASDSEPCSDSDSEAQRYNELDPPPETREAREERESKDEQATREISENLVTRKTRMPRKVDKSQGQKGQAQKAQANRNANREARGRDRALSHEDDGNGVINASEHEVYVSKILCCLFEGNANEHLVGIYNGEVKSERHDKFFSKDPLQKCSLKSSSWFGPVLHKDQHQQIFDYFRDIFLACCAQEEQSFISGYIYEVWIPEAIIKAISLVQEVSQEDAEQIFSSDLNPFLGEDISIEAIAMYE